MNSSPAFCLYPTVATRSALIVNLFEAMRLLSEPVVYATVLVALCLILYNIIYNIYLHPLSHILGSTKRPVPTWESE
jgi:hypothetical protein